MRPLALVVSMLIAAPLVSCSSDTDAEAPKLEVEWTATDVCPMSPAYWEFALFESDCPDNTCGDLEARLTAGDTAGALRHQVTTSIPEAQTASELESRKYAFAVVARDADCKPIATGCTCADAADIKLVEINVAAWANCVSAGQCSMTEACSPLSGGAAGDCSGAQ
ncbi:MAG: hypothetical protein H6718_08475 [Polyangiaceae bacterium]|nr:hypothetical protein [Polyangiaceae bacterium]